MFRKNLKYILIVAVLVVVIFASLHGADNPAKSILLGVSSPFLKTFRIFSGGVSGFFDFIGSIGDLKNENERLIGENQKLTADNNRLQDAGKENDILRRQLELAPRKDFDLEAVYIIGQDPQGLGNYFIVDKGANVGIRTGMPAIVSDGILIGKVSDVYANTAKIRLMTDPGSAINAETLDSGTKGIVRGEYGLGLKMDMMSQSDVLNEGDAVITSGLGGELPKGLTIGKISQIGQSADKLFQEAAIVPAVDSSGLRVVFLVKGW
jgi:rod shape-determining protein MreC